MFFVTALLALHSLPHARSIKVIIDGTIDFGPNWNVDYRLKPMIGRTNDNPNILRMNDAFITKPPESNPVTAENLDDTNRENVDTFERDNSVGEINEENVSGVTKMYETRVKNVALFRKPRKIRDETKVIEFVDHIKDSSLKMFDGVREKLEDKDVAQKINDLKARYANKFQEFENDTKNHKIRTAFGNKKVILNTINFSNNLLNRLVNRFKVDVEDNGLRGGSEASKTFEEHKDKLRNVAYEDACSMLSICRTDNEFTDHMSELITILLATSDAKLQSAVRASAKALKRADFSKIMDEKTQDAFKKKLSSLEELNPFDLRVMLTAYKMVIDNRYKPFLNKDPKNPLLAAAAALFHVIEGFNKKIDIDQQDWSRIKKNFQGWIAGDAVEVQGIADELVDLAQSKIAALDSKTANDFRAKLRLLTDASSLKVNLSNYVQFQPFAI